jgi:hypothetical protein
MDICVNIRNWLLKRDKTLSVLDSSFLMSAFLCHVLHILLGNLKCNHSSLFLPCKAISSASTVAGMCGDCGPKSGSVNSELAA